MDAWCLFFEHLAAEWDARQPVNREEKLDRLIASFDGLIKAADTILEVGTGTGGLLPILKQHNPAAGIIQIDFASAMLLRAQANRNGDHLVQADVHQLPFGIILFNLVICHNSFPPFRFKPLVLQSLCRVLQSGGQLLILHEINHERVNEVHQRASAFEIHQDLLPENDEMRRLLAGAGFLNT